MSCAMPVQQRGISFGGFLMGAFLLVIIGISLLKLVPAYIEYARIDSVFAEIVRDSAMDKASPREIRAAFEKRASIDDISAISANDIDIASDGGRLDLSASYSVKVPLFGNVSIILEFNPRSDK